MTIKGQVTADFVALNDLAERFAKPADFVVTYKTTFHKITIFSNLNLVS